MRRLALILLPLLLFGAFDQKIFEEALQRAKKEHKIILLEATSPQCHYCQWMERTTLADPEVQKILDKHFIFLQVDVTKESLPLGLEWSMTPSFIFISSDKKVLKKIPGAWKKEDFLMILREVIR